MNSAEIDLPLAEFAKELEVTLDLVLQRVALDLMGRIVLRTPVDTGRARSSWDLSIGSPSDWIPPELPGKGKRVAAKQSFTSSFAGGQAQNAGLNTKSLSTASAITSAQPIWIVSNLPYIEALENGHSKQAPVGMVVLSVAEIETEIELLLAKIIAGKNNPNP